ncbi:hypothetical protein GALL_487030 [mine drainage metagenome]|uniref:Uncharacterized protein n=1 Tax=mine drainage metagenome TaxID=410659 RepID=A0A1J5PPJ4_9ZZZZ
MLILAEEVSLVCGDGINEVDEFGFEAAPIEQENAIVGEPLVPMNPHPLAQAALNHDPFCRRQLDARVIADESCDARILLIGQPIGRRLSVRNIRAAKWL